MTNSCEGLPDHLALRALRVWHLPPLDRYVAAYLGSLAEKSDIAWSGNWTRATTERVASGLLRIAADFGTLTGGVYKEFAPYHLPDESFVYLLLAMKEAEHNARRVFARSTGGCTS